MAVVIDDGLRDARAACERAFAFLMTDFGYRRFQWGGFLLRYRGPVIGVQIAWYPRDELTVWLVKLLDGDFPPYPITIHPDTALHYFDLGDLEAISGQDRPVSQRQLYALPPTKPPVLWPTASATAAPICCGATSRSFPCSSSASETGHGRT
jgi:hypothetical protein